MPTYTIRDDREGATTEAMVRRRHRDFIIRLAHGSGVSQRILAEVFDLSRARIQTILAAKPDTLDFTDFGQS